MEEIFAQGYDPVHAFGEALWFKRLADARLYTHRGALRDIEEDRRSRARKR